MYSKGKRDRISERPGDLFQAATLAPSSNTPALLPEQQITITVTMHKILTTNSEISIKEVYPNAGDTYNYITCEHTGIIIT